MEDKTTKILRNALAIVSSLLGVTLFVVSLLNTDAPGWQRFYFGFVSMLSVGSGIYVFTRK